MQRRDLLKIITAGAAVPVLSPDLFAFFQAAHPSASYALRTFNAHQNSTVIAMSDLIIPETVTPGAKAVKVNEFMDLIFTDWAEADEKEKFLAGLANVDTRSNALCGKDFVDCTQAQQQEILRILDQEIAVEREGIMPHARPPRIFDNQLKGSFFAVFKRMTLYGYYTSEIGFKQELKQEIIPGAYHGCAPLAPESKV